MNRLTPAWLTTPEVVALHQAFEHAGHPMRFVGGCVRDAVMGRTGTDIDIATPASPDAVMALLAGAQIRALPTGIKHGTVTAVMEHRQFEITTLRQDAACDGRHAEVVFTDDWRADASRRDFTINAMYLDTQGVLYDYFGGLEDIAARRIRFIGDAQARIREDYLRILRFFRFYATHGAPPADAIALTACTAEAAGLEQLSGERIHTEMFKLLAAPDPVPSLRLMGQCGVLEKIQVAPPFYAALEQPTPPDALLRLMLLLGGNVSCAEQISTRWRFSGVERERLLKGLAQPLPKTLTEKDAKVFLRREGSTYYRDWLYRARLAHTNFAEGFDALLALPERWPPPIFPVSGHDLMALGMPAGEALGNTLKTLEAQWEASDYTLGKEALVEMAKAQ